MRAFLTLLALLVAVPAFAQEPLPSEQPDRFGLAIIDTETTGLDPRHHELIDFGAIYTDLDGRELGRFYVKILPDHPERLDAVAKQINGFDEAYWRANGAVSEEEALARLLAFHARTAGERRMLFTAYNAPFDVGFVDAWFAEHGRKWRDTWHWNPIDLPSIAWGMGYRHTRNAAVGRAFGMEPETSVPLDHTGLSGAEWNLDLYRRMLAKQEKAKRKARR